MKYKCIEEFKAWCYGSLADETTRITIHAGTLWRLSEDYDSVDRVELHSSDGGIVLLLPDITFHRKFKREV